MISDHDFEKKMIEKYNMNDLEAEIYSERMAIILEDEHISLINAHQTALQELFEYRRRS